jgi:hypothetical protein
VPARIHYERSNVALIKASAAQYVANAQRFGEELRLLS